MTVIDIIRQYLKANGYDGLAGDECGCGLDDLVTCGEDPSHCEPAYACKCACGECDCDHREGFIARPLTIWEHIKRFFGVELKIDFHDEE